MCGAPRCAEVCVCTLRYSLLVVLDVLEGFEATLARY